MSAHADKGVQVRRVLWYTLFCNEGVAILKIVWGYSTGSVGMVSDGFHSMLDGVTNIMGLVGMKLASEPPDHDHPYGHNKFETLSTVIIAAMIFFTCSEILRRAYHVLSTGATEVTVNAGSFAVMLITLAINIAVMTYERKRGQELGSDFLLADAMHTKSDVLTTTSVLIGLVGVKMGFPMADALAGVVIVFFIAKAGYDILRHATGVLVDSACLDMAQVERVVLAVEGVQGCHKIRTRGSASHVHLDMHLHLDETLTLPQAHALCHRVQDEIRGTFPQVVDIVVHAEPVPNHNHSSTKGA